MSLRTTPEATSLEIEMEGASSCVPAGITASYVMRYHNTAIGSHLYVIAVCIGVGVCGILGPPCGVPPSWGPWGGQIAVS